MKRHSAGNVMMMVFTVAAMVAFLRPAMGEPPGADTSQRDLSSAQRPHNDASSPRDREDRMNAPLQSDQSSPRDSNPYVRPAIPEDRIKTPPTSRGAASDAWPSRT
jgi:hypothetical protein